MRPPDAAFADPRLAELYDLLDHDRSDLDAYVAIAREVGAERIADVGCGTGSLAVRLGAEGFTVVGVDPAEASLDMARRKGHAHRVTWIHGDATDLAGTKPVDLVVMTGNVAQVFVADQDWHDTLAAIGDTLRPGGRLVFETRRPEARAWEQWDRPPTEVTLPDGRAVVVAMSVRAVALPLVTFEGWTTIGGEVVPSTSTLRFRQRDEIASDLDRHGFDVDEVRDAPDRPGLEHVFLCTRREA